MIIDIWQLSIITPLVLFMCNLLFFCSMKKKNVIPISIICEHSDFHWYQNLIIRYRILSTENIALWKETYQQYPLNNNPYYYDSSNAVDGLKSDLSSSGGQCVYSSDQNTATWWVNLLGIASIHHVTIYFLTGNYPWGMYLEHYNTDDVHDIKTLPIPLLTGLKLAQNFLISNNLNCLD